MTAKLASIAVRRYRCFAHEFRLDLTPVTLLYGWNNAGKSAALRLIGLLNDSLQPDARVPFNTMGRFGREASFLDLEWKGSADSDEPGFGLELAWSGGSVQSVRYQLDYSRERNEPYVRRLVLRTSQHPTETIEFRATDRPSVYQEGDASTVSLQFSGLVPEFLPHTVEPATAIAEPIRNLRDQLAALRGGLQWLGITRSSLPREIANEKPPPDMLGPDGEAALELLIREPDLLRRVAQWYACPEIGRDLRVRPVSPRLSGLQLSASSGPSAAFEIPLADTGAGMSQVLPVLTAVSVAARRASQGRPAVLSVEEPESQLHGNAMRALVDWICGVAQADSPPSLLLETHSRALLVAFQLAVAEGRLSNDRFQVYWLSLGDDGATVAQVARLNADGVYDGSAALPPSAFAHEYELNDRYLQHILGGDQASVRSPE